MNGQDTRHIPLRHHMIKAAGRSLRHAYSKIIGDADVPTNSLEKGTAVHAIVFNTAHVVAAPMARNEKHAAWREFRDAHEGCLIVTASQLEEANRIADAVRSNTWARELLESAECFEQTHYFEQSGRACRATEDVTGRGAWFADLKTCENVSKEAFSAAIARYGYDTAIDWYGRRLPGRTGYLIAVETSAPYDVAVRELGTRTLERARALNDRRLEQILLAERMGYWPGTTPDGIEVIDAPEYILREYDYIPPDDADDSISWAREDRA